MQNRLHAQIVLAALTTALMAGCSDPSDNVHKTTASAPKQVAAAPAGVATDYVIRAESKIGFAGSKVTGSHSGGFKNVAGKVSVAGGKSVSGAEVKIGMQSTWSDNDRLTGHLKSPDFFDATTFPVSTFSITKIEPAGDQHQVTGNLNLHGVSRSITFPAKIQVAAGEVKVNSEFAINRRDYNINYPGKPNDLIRDNVVITLDLKATPGAARPEDQLAN